MRHISTNVYKSIIMKKILILSLCAVLCAAFTSCEKENPGVYNPKKKIQKLYCEYGGQKYLWQDWNWNGKLLTSVNYYTSEGVVMSTENYSYDKNNRIVRIQEGNENLDFSYENGKIKAANYYWANTLEESYNFIYENNTLSKIECVSYYSYVDDKHQKRLNPLAVLMPQGGDVLTKAVKKLNTQQKGEEKAILELTWEGKNISHIHGYTVDDEDGETMDAYFTYDDKINPFKGWSPMWFDEVIGMWDDSYCNTFNYGNMQTSSYIYKEGGIEYDRYNMVFSYEYEGNYPVKMTVSEEGENDYEFLLFEY